MATKVFRLPDLGEGLTESEVVAWRVSAGDAVAAASQEASAGRSAAAKRRAARAAKRGMGGGG